MDRYGNKRRGEGHDKGMLSARIEEAASRRSPEEMLAELVDILEPGVFIAENVDIARSSRFSALSRFNVLFGQECVGLNGQVIKDNPSKAVYVGPNTDVEGLAKFILETKARSASGLVDAADTVRDIERLKAQGVRYPDFAVDVQAGKPATVVMSQRNLTAA